MLPLARESRPGLAGPVWVSGPGSSATERMYLIPGDSPMGYRLPLESLPWASKSDQPYLHEHDPFAHPAPLPLHADIRAQYAPHAIGGGFAEGGAVAMQAGFEGTGELAPRGALTAAAGGAAVDHARVPGRFESAHWITRTALCVEVREGVLYVFMPPLAALERLPRPAGRSGGHGGRSRREAGARRLPAAARSAPADAAGDARPGRDRGEHPPGARLGRTGRPHRVPLRGGVQDAAGDREVHARRPPYRHRRRQPLRARRRHAGRQPVPAPAGPARQPDLLLAQPPVAVVPVLGPVHRPDQPGAAGRRGAQRPAVRAGDRAGRARAQPRAPGRTCRPGWSTARCATS